MNIPTRRAALGRKFATVCLQRVVSTGGSVTSAVLNITEGAGLRHHRHQQCGGRRQRPTCRELTDRCVDRAMPEGSQFVKVLTETLGAA